MNSKSLHQYSYPPAMATGPIHPNALHYRYIDTDYGDTYTHRRRRVSDRRFAAEILPAIGTYGCSSCVGVYMDLSPTTCFVAHINAAYLPANYASITRDDILYDLRIATETEGGYVRDGVVRKLLKASRCMNWPPVDQIRNVVIVCPVTNHPISVATLSGTHIVQGIRQFLGRRDVPVNTQSEGFVVSHETGVVQYFPWPESDEVPPLPDNGRDFVAHNFMEMNGRVGSSILESCGGRQASVGW